MLVLRLLLGAVFIYAAYTKLRQSWLLFALSIDSYQLLPEWAVYALARTLPLLELALGVLLMAGVVASLHVDRRDRHPGAVFPGDDRLVLPRRGHRLRLLRRGRTAERQNARPRRDSGRVCGDSGYGCLGDEQHKCVAIRDQESVRSSGSIS